jgi:hypothetical protein
VAQAPDCDQLRQNLRSSLPANVQSLSLAELQRWPQEFSGSGSSEPEAIQQAQARVAEAIFLRAESSVSKSAEFKRRNEVEEFQERSTIQRRTQSALDLPLPQPEIFRCDDGSVLAVYRLTAQQLAAPSIRYARDIQRWFDPDTQQQPEEASWLARILGSDEPDARAFSQLLRAYRSAVLFERRARYREIALRLAGLAPPEDSTTIRQNLDPLLSALRLEQTPEFVTLEPDATRQAYRFRQALLLSLEYAGEPIADVTLRVEFLAQQQKHTEISRTDSSGQVQLTSLPLKVVPVAAKLERQSQLDATCPYAANVQLDLGEAATQPLELGTLAFECATLSALQYREAERTGTYAAFRAFLQRFPESPEAAEASRAMYAVVRQTDRRESYEQFLRDFPNAAEREDALRRLFQAIDREGTWEAYLDFVQSYPDAAEKAEAVEAMEQIARRQPEDSLEEKENKLARLRVVVEVGGRFVDTAGLSREIERLEAAIEAERIATYANPLTEDAYVLTMRSIGNPDVYLHPELRIDPANEGLNWYSLSRLMLGKGWQQSASVMLESRYEPQWEQPVRELHVSGQFRVYGKPQDPQSLALGGVFTSYAGDRTLLSNDDGENEGVDDDGESQFVPTEDEWELYAVGIGKFPAYDSLLHAYVGTLQVQGAWQYFVATPDLSLVTEFAYRHQAYTVARIEGDTDRNRNFDERQAQAEARRLDLRVGLKLGNVLQENAKVQTKLFYSSQQEAVLLGIGASF